MLPPASVEKKVYSSIHKKNVERTYFLKNFKKLVEKYEYIFLFPHVSPDGDCIGGVLGFKESLKDTYPEKKIFAVGSNFGLYDWLEPKFDEMPKDFDFSHSLAVIIDVGTKDRVQQYHEYFELPKKKFADIVKIDHHESPPDINFTLSWDDGTYVAACVQLIQIIDYYNWSLTKRAATFLYLGIYTDSGRFVFPATLPRSLVIAAKAWRAGADYRFIHTKITLRTWHSIEVEHYLLSNCKKEGNIIWFYLTADVIKEKNIKHTKGLIGTFQNIFGVKVWVMFTDADNGIKVEFRSMEIDVKGLAVQFGGGGHENAAGTLIKDAKLIPEIVAATKKLADSAGSESQPRLMQSGHKSSKVEECVHESIKTAKDSLKEAKKLVGDKDQK